VLNCNSSQDLSARLLSYSSSSSCSSSSSSSSSKGGVLGLAWLRWKKNMKIGRKSSPKGNKQPELLFWSEPINHPLVSPSSIQYESFDVENWSRNSFYISHESATQTSTKLTSPWSSRKQSCPLTLKPSLDSTKALYLPTWILYSWIRCSFCANE